MAEQETPADQPSTDESTHRTKSTAKVDKADKADKTSRRRLLHLLGTSGVVGIAGCASEEQSREDSPTVTKTSGSEATPTPTDAPELQQNATVANKRDLTHSRWEAHGGVMPYFNHTLEPLIWVGEKLEKQPWLAESWERTGEGVFEFTLRDGVMFHNSEPLTADHVVWSFKTYLDFYDFAPSWLHLKPEGIKTVDDRTVKFTTSPPLATFPGLLAHPVWSVQHPDREAENFEVIGTGPYQVEEVQKGQHVKVSAFDNYWGNQPITPELTFRVMTDATTRTLALNANEIDVAIELPYNKVKSVRNSEETKVITEVLAQTAYVGIHTKKPPTNDIKLRKALNYAVSQEVIVESVLNGIGEPARGVVSPTIYWSAHSELPEYGPNKEKAKQLVDASGYNGETLRMLLSKFLSPTNAKLVGRVGKSFRIVGAVAETKS